MYLRPAIFRDAFIGTVLALIGAYVVGAVFWTWLAWSEQRFDLVRLAATAFGFGLIAWGIWLIRMWLHREWFEEPERRWEAWWEPDGDSSSGSDAGGGGDGGSGSD